jgi:hypothetical protein
MDEGKLNQMLDTATGEALYATCSQEMLWALLIKSGIISKEQAREALDHALYVLEKARETRPGGGPGAIDHARSRLSGMIQKLSDAKT